MVWTDNRSGAAEVYLRSSFDAGANWHAVKQVSVPDGRSSWVPAVACRGPEIHVAWSDERHNIDAAGMPYDCGTAGDSSQCREEEYYRRSTDFGATWEPEVRLTFDPDASPRPSWAPSITVWANNVHVTFFDQRTDRFEVYYMRSTAGGVAGSWEPERIISPAGGSSTRHARPVIAALGPSLHVVWFSVTSSVGVQVWHARSKDSGGSFPPAVPLTTYPIGVEAHPSVATSPLGTAHAIWYAPDWTGIDQIMHRAWRWW